MITVYQFPPAFGLPNASPFCMKLETWLRMAGLRYETVNNSRNVMKAPKGKLPFVQIGPQKLTDSSFIIEFLKQRHGDRLDAGLSAVDRAHATAYQRLLEENFYWCMVYTRWADNAGWVHTKQAFFSQLPPPFRWFVAALARRGILANLDSQGMGRHAPDEIHAIGCRDISAVADFLGDKPFMLGDKPSTLDATAFAFLANLLWAPVQSPLLRHAQTRPNLEAYCQRMKARYFPDGTASDPAGTQPSVHGETA
jgi:glutathione S-transferase